ncbi:uncharacterized protein MONBRDRAFT_7321 [Monosiga brevicollis MX1]|uniref:UBC core domain-containing protein n=1 Tax=Monosiga brevicollis TaxID=81824 RepID=A9UWL8_MONBE|nr:uncharacterized protein MONBRDRAFT_7321 [Monosiga brevicollis MX1]EDQ90234.1 predicted protein [Monosiga brevicollis MX1]|eukprot:XP_001745001.1 hypothetical protein [Monosiga brevicollis MX1]
MDADDYREKLRTLDRLIAELKAQGAHKDTSEEDRVKAMCHRSCQPSKSRRSLAPCLAIAWDAVYFVREGIYRGGIFKLRLLIPPTYPDKVVPRIFFQSNVFHPRVNDITGELDMSRYYVSWNPDVDRLKHLFKYVHKMFRKIDADNAVNEGAAAMFRVSMEAFEAPVQRCVKASQATAHTPTGNSIELGHSDNRDGIMQAIKDYMQSLRQTANPDDSHSARIRGRLESRHKSLTSAVLTERMVQRASNLASVESLDHHVASPATCGTRNLCRLGDDACAGYVTYFTGEGASPERRWLFLSESAGHLRLYKTEREEDLITELATRDVCRCYEPDSTTQRASNGFVVVTPDMVLRLGALSSNGLLVWRSAILHASAFGEPRIGHEST